MFSTDTLPTVGSVIARFSSPSIHTPRLGKHTYAHTDNPARVGLAVKSMSEHMTDEGWQIFQGLEANGYSLYGHGIGDSDTDVSSIVKKVNPGTVFIQDVREWDADGRDFRDVRAKFTYYSYLGLNPHIYKVTILKDAHQRPDYHRRFMDDIQAHAVVCYYHPRIVAHLAQYLHPGALVRTYHTIDADRAPPLPPKGERQGAVISGALSAVYPLRQKIVRAIRNVPLTAHLPHPGYHRKGACNYRYMESLSRYRISICTCSVYGYALRKIVESVAAGCVVITNLPTDDVLPEIDGALVRVPDTISPRRVGDIVRELYAAYDEDRQRHYAELCRQYYDYRAMTTRLAADIERHRLTYNQENPCTASPTSPAATS